MSLKVLTIAIIAAFLLLAPAKARSTARLTKVARIEGDSGELGDDDTTQTCDVDSHSLASKFTELSHKLDLVDSDGEQCSAEANYEVDLSVTTSSCGGIYGFIEQLLVDLDVTKHCCLTDNSTCTNSTSKTNPAKAYGYGFLMVTFVSLLSLLGLILLPFIRGNPTLAKIYVYINTFLIALGTSAVFSGAILHLLPRILGLDDNKDGYLVKGTVISLGLYVLYLFEVTLHTCNAHYHGDSVESTIPHHANKEPPSTSHAVQASKTTSFGGHYDQDNEKQGLLESKKPQGYFHGVRPLAWIIVFGDSIHNFADGITLGAAISHSLSLGLSMTVAIVLHEIPHEIGDYAILLSTGLSWYAAILLNFFSSLTAIIGFFVGVAIGTNSAAANNWILTIAVGLFLYVALVDLLPEIIHSKERGYKRLIHILVANIGFFISFAVLFLIALYEDALDNIFHV